MFLEPVDLDAAQPRGEPNGALVGGLGAQHDRFAWQDADEPVQRGGAGLEGATVAPCLGEEHVAELDLVGFGTSVVGSGRLAPVEGDHTDGRAGDLDHEESGT